MELDAEQLENSFQDSDNESLNGTDESQSAMPEITELDKLEKFKWQGKEYSPKDLQNMVLMRQDYTRKTQELSEARKYVDNLEVDLEAVKNDPSLADKFKEIYPEQYHKYLDYILSQNPQQQNQERSSEEDDRVARLEKKLSAWEQDKHQTQVQAIEREIDAEINKAINTHKDLLKTDSMKSRFEIDCITLARQLHGEGTQLTPEIWQKIGDHVAQDLASLSNVSRSDIVKKQSAASQNARDIPPGGGVPGTAPKKFKSLREAMHAAMDDNEL